jgi:hypothetical protein
MLRRPTSKEERTTKAQAQAHRPVAVALVVVVPCVLSVVVAQLCVYYVCRVDCSEAETGEARGIEILEWLRRPTSKQKTTQNKPTRAQTYRPVAVPLVVLMPCVAGVVVSQLCGLCLCIHVEH